MAKRSVIWTPRAEAELKEVLHFYINRNKSTSYSARLLDDIEKMTGLVSRFPYLGRLTSNGVTRVVVKGKYLLFLKYTATQSRLCPFGTIDETQKIEWLNNFNF
jgi:plasmid stabilization system protein ParE